MASLPGMTAMDALLEKDKVYKALKPLFKLKTGAERMLLESLMRTVYETRGRGFKDTNAVLERYYLLEDNVPLDCITYQDDDLMPDGRWTAGVSSAQGAGRDRAERQSVEGAAPVIATPEELRRERTCKVCLDTIIELFFLPCGHAVCCKMCASTITDECPICRAKIIGSRSIYF